VFEGNVMTAMV